MIASGIAAIVAGAIGAILVATGNAEVPGRWGEIIPPAKYVAFSADAWAHAASYGVGALGGIVVIGQTIWRRIRKTSAR
jgi:cobalamin biosynthesis protein CbiG